MEPNSSEILRPIPKVRFSETPGSSESMKKYNISDEYGAPVGEVSLLYYSRRKEIEIGMVEIPEEGLRNQGYGLAIYEGIGHLASPDGLKYRLVSSGQPSENSDRVWESLVKRGLAIKEESGRYVMLESEVEQEEA